jgi:hypothetical protein
MATSPTAATAASPEAAAADPYCDRWRTATCDLPFGGDAKDFFERAADEADIFAMGTAKADQGGPFGAALWVVQATEGPGSAAGRPNVRYTFIGPNLSSNAVLSTGIASNHAEANDLDLQRRNTCMRYLRRVQRDKLARNIYSKGQERTRVAVVQVSSGESCSSCRAKQCLFAENLYALGLLERGCFFVAYKASYERTFLDAGFNDKPYDMGFRVMRHRGVLDDPQFLASVETNTTCRADLKATKAFTVPVKIDIAGNVPKFVAERLAALSNGRRRPCAVVVSRPNPHHDAAAGDESDGRVIWGEAYDERRRYSTNNGNGNSSNGSSGSGAAAADNSSLNRYELSAVTLALHRACTKRRANGVFESWNLDGATVYTNLHELGPLAYSETLWCNVNAIVTLAHDFGSSDVELAGRECPTASNRDFFKRVAAEYNSAESSIRVRHLGKTKADPAVSDAVRRHQPSIAHVYWRALSASEGLKGAFQEYMQGGEAAKRFSVSVFPIAGPWSKFPTQDMQYNGGTVDDDDGPKQSSKL